MAKRKRKLTEDELACLPPSVRWVGEHPLLYVKEEDMNAKWRKTERDYLAKHPCPHHLAQNMFTQYRANPARLEKLYWRIFKRYSEFQAKEEKQNKTEEDAAIADLEVAMAAALGAIKA